MNINAQEITAENFVEKIASQVKHYPQEPMYFFRANAHNCVYEILVNDFPIEKHYRLGWNATPTDFNRAILKSGKQTLTYRLYPIGNLLGDEERVNTLLSTTQIEIEIFRVDDHRTYTSDEDEKIVINHTSDKKEDKFVGAGLPYYEYTFEFEAKVPYENEGWSKGIDLRKVDSMELKAKVFQYYKKIQALYEKQDLGGILKMNYAFQARNSIAEYRTKEEIQKILDYYKRSAYYKGKEFQPLKKYEFQFFGGGTITAFKHTSKEPINKRLRGNNALWFKYKTESGGTRGQFLGAYLYAPKDKQQNGLHLEMIN
ncbi:hypothetical protein [Flagellimonas onchidii]|uniref:hypothetical protein n=1 Tax=Flagellimonas onchidii TaxID=2562684 RepID=UPI0010A679BA|nr:hypothetical protein [Allomuricauda onchidii]